MLTRRELLVTATSALTVGALGGVAFAEPDEALVARAREEGSITWYTGIVVNQLVRPVVAGFKQRYGIDVRFTSVTEAETVLRMRSEANAGQNLADLFDSSGAVFPPLLASGLVGQFQPSNAASFSPESMCLLFRRNSGISSISCSPAGKKTRSSWIIRWKPLSGSSVKFFPI